MNLYEGAEDIVVLQCQYCCTGFGIFNQIRMIPALTAAMLNAFNFKTWQFLVQYDYSLLVVQVRYLREEVHNPIR